MTFYNNIPHGCRPHNYSGLVDYSRGPLDYKALMTFALASERECDVMTIVIVVLVARYSRTLHITLMSHFIFTIWSFGIGGERGIEWCPINFSSTAVSVDGHQLCKGGAKCTEIRKCILYTQNIDPNAIHIQQHRSHYSSQLSQLCIMNINERND